MAGRVQLLTSGPQDRFFTLNPDYSYFLQSFKKHSNFAREYVNIDPEMLQILVVRSDLEFLKIQGDLLTTISVEDEIAIYFYSNL
jgi:hypothetical protein